MTAPPRTRREARAGWAASAGAREAREACGITLATIARALGVGRMTVGRYERGLRTPAGELGARYQRIVEGLRRHLEVPVEEDGGDGEAGWDWCLRARPVTAVTLRAAVSSHRRHHCQPAAGGRPGPITDCPLPACQALVSDLRQQRAETP